MKTNDIFFEKDYTQAYQYVCENNKTMIKEISADENGRRFQILEIPTPTDGEILDNLRMQREEECFLIINRGQLWYDTLSNEYKAELNDWYHAWLDVTETKVVPDKPVWLK